MSARLGAPVFIGSRWLRGRPKVAMLGAVFLSMVVGIMFASPPAAHAVSSRPPQAAKSVGFVFGHLPPHRPVVTQRVVATLPVIPSSPAAPAAAPHVPATSPAAPPTVSAAPATTQLPARGHATAFGCAAAIADLTAYSAPGFVIQCPAYAGGHQATTTCATTTSLCNVERLIQIADPCAAAYMNEASNSWVLLGQSNAPIDPYGKCY
jgi:hypothetical protein